jgi:hypothetical protein
MFRRTTTFFCMTLRMSVGRFCGLLLYNSMATLLHPHMLLTSALVHYSSSLLPPPPHFSHHSVVALVAVPLDLRVQLQVWIYVGHRPALHLRGRLMVQLRRRTVRQQVEHRLIQLRHGRRIPEEGVVRRGRGPEIDILLLDSSATG